jgi:hypothetical protein
MGKREIAKVLWHRRGNYLNVTFAAGDREQLVGSWEMAAKLAEEAGLSLVPTADDTVRWVRGGDAHPDALPA